MATNIFLIRHGQSDANKRNAFIGHTDLDLTEKGHAQAEKAAEFLMSVHCDAIYSSDLMRAYNTAEHTSRKKGIPVILSEQLREINGGEWENMDFATLRLEYRDTFALWCDNVGLSACPGGESVLEMMDRVEREIERIAKKHDGQDVFIFNHSTPIRTLTGRWRGLDIKDLDITPWPANASVTQVRYDNGKFEVIDYARKDFMEELVTFFSDEL
ncbi:MAG: histidine phosphatase family protein [Clostridia bacterium]|nr:histidine phosphatase family protein [Clostridia bacterium]